MGGAFHMQSSAIAGRKREPSRVSLIIEQPTTRAKNTYLGRGGASVACFQVSTSKDLFLSPSRRTRFKRCIS